MLLALLLLAAEDAPREITLETIAEVPLEARSLSLLQLEDELLEHAKPTLWVWMAMIGVGAPLAIGGAAYTWRVAATPVQPSSAPYGGLVGLGQLIVLANSFGATAIGAGLAITGGVFLGLRVARRRALEARQSAVRLRVAELQAGRATAPEATADEVRRHTQVALEHRKHNLALPIVIIAAGAALCANGTMFFAVELANFSQFRSQGFGGGGVAGLVVMAVGATALSLGIWRARSLSAANASLDDDIRALDPPPAPAVTLPALPPHLPLFAWSSAW